MSPALHRTYRMLTRLDGAISVHRGMTALTREQWCAYGLNHLGWPFDLLARE
jgi:hypothetical protein